PVVVIASPASGSHVIEGQALVIEVNATDDVGIERVALTVDGLVSGPRTLIDYDYPYEFLVNVPYGQAGKPLTLTVTATERRATNARTVNTLEPVIVQVDADTEAPVLTLLAQGTGATAVESRTVGFRYEA